MTPTERRAIAEARSRREVLEQVETSEHGTSLVGTGGIAEPASGLTRHERQAARDDPAVHLPGHPLPAAVEEPDAPVDAPRVRTPSRPGVVLRGASSGLKLVDLAIAPEVRRREPIGTSDRFLEMPRMFHCFCVFENRQEPGTVTHVWKRDGRVVSRVELEVGKSPKWRTWSRQRLQATWTGEWSCEVQAPGGRVLGVATARAGP